MSFSFSNPHEVDSIISLYPKKSSAVLPVLKLAQKECGGWLPNTVLEHVASLLGMSYMQIMEIATFYSMFRLTPPPPQEIKICRTLSCWLNGAEKIEKECLKNNIPFRYVECVGYCDHAPVIQINDEDYQTMNWDKPFYKAI